MPATAFNVDIKADPAFCHIFNNNLIFHIFLFTDLNTYN